jgi:hypothetical protein
VAAVRRQLGPLERPLERPPDLTIRFVDALPPAGRLRLIGLREAAHDDASFYVLRSRHKAPARVAVPLDRIGADLEITCEREIAAIPYLIALVNLLALGNGGLPLHAAAFEWDGTGFLVTGWSKGGKTEALLGATRAGARYVGDEWVYVLPDGRHLAGIPEPVRVWSWHLRQMPDVRRTLPAWDRLRLAAGTAGLGVLRATRRLLPAGGRPGRLARRLGTAMDAQMHVDLPPGRLFGGRPGTPAAGDGAAGGERPASSTTTLDRLLLVVSVDEPGIRVVPAAAAEVAARMAGSLQYEMRELVALYRAFRFAFPERSSAAIEGAEALQRERLAALLAGVPAFRVEHPYPVDLAALAAAIAPLREVSR